MLRVPPMALAVLAFGCGWSSPTSVADTHIEVNTIPVDELSALDPARTYEHDIAQVDPDSVLAALLDARIPVVRAWLALDNRCLAPRGPRFTVELAGPDARILALDFGPGTGRLVCATTLRRYTVSD